VAVVDNAAGVGRPPAYGMLSGVYTMIVVTEDQLTPHDVTRIATLHGDEPLHVHVIQPVDTEHNRLVETLDEILLGRLREAAEAAGEEDVSDAALAARNALDGSLAALRDAGIEHVDGELAPDDPVPTAADAVSGLDADEVLVLTSPHFIEEALNQDWASRLRHRTHRPVLHVISGTDRVVS